MICQTNSCLMKAFLIKMASSGYYVKLKMNDAMIVLWVTVRRTTERTNFENCSITFVLAGAVASPALCLALRVALRLHWLQPLHTHLSSSLSSHCCSSKDKFWQLTPMLNGFGGGIACRARSRRGCGMSVR